MSTIFISYSSRDRSAADAVYQMLVEMGYEPPFRDDHPEAGIPAGSDWHRELFRKLRLCRAVVVLASRNWMESKWCFAEFAYAKAMGKELFPVLLDDVVKVPSLLSERQAIHLSEPDFSHRLQRGLIEADLAADNDFPWPVKGLDECPYPGLAAFEMHHAGVYFGREDEIMQLRERLNQMNDEGEPRLLYIVGASGSGKSSLIKAGLLPRLTHKESHRWCVLPTFRWNEIRAKGRDWPEQLAVSLLDLWPPQAASRPSWKALTQRYSLPPRFDEPSDDQAGVDSYRKLLADCATNFIHDTKDMLAARGQRHATPLLFIDQFEELFWDAHDGSVTPFLDLLGSVVSSPFSPYRCLATIRTDFLEVIQKRPELVSWKKHTDHYLLHLMQADKFFDVVRRPAEKIGFEFESDALVNRIVDHTETNDALPLLAFALHELYHKCKHAGRLTSEGYEQIGGVRGCLATVGSKLLNESGEVTDRERERRLHIVFSKHLVHINEKGKFVRRTAAWSEFDEDAYPILQRFIDRRLITSRLRDEADPDSERVVEVTHDALFDAWEQLHAWLVKITELLTARARVEASAQRWRQEDRDRELLLPPGKQLAEAVDLLKSDNVVLGDVACQYTLESQKAAKEIELEKEIAESTSRFRAQLLTVTGIAAILLAAALVIAAWQWDVARDRGDALTTALSNEKKALGEERLAKIEAQRSRTEAELSVSRERGLLAEITAAKTGKELAALALGVQAVGTELLNGRIPTEQAYRGLELSWRNVWTALPLGKGELIAVSDNGKAILTRNHLGEFVEVWESATGRRRAKISAKNPIERAALSSDGDSILTADSLGQIALWDVDDGSRQIITPRPGKGVKEVMFLHQAERILIIDRDGKINIGSTDSTKPLVEFASNVKRAEPSADGSRLLTWENGGRAYPEVWSTDSGNRLYAVEWATGSAQFVRGSNDLFAYSHQQPSETPVRLAILSGDTGDVRAETQVNENIVAIHRSAKGKVLVFDGSGELTIFDEELRQQSRHDLPNFHRARLTADGAYIALAHARAISVYSEPAGRSEPYQVWHLPLDKIPEQVFIADERSVVFAKEMERPRRQQHRLTQTYMAVLRHTDPRQVDLPDVPRDGSFSLLPDGQRFLLRFNDRIELRSFPSGELIETIRQSDGRILFSPDGGLISIVDRGGNISVFDAKTGMPRPEPEGLPTDVRVPTFSPDGELLAASCDDGQVAVWNTLSGRRIKSFVPPARAGSRLADYPITHVSFGPSGKRLVTIQSNTSPSVRQWDVDSGLELAALHAPDYSSQAVYSANGKWLFVAHGQTGSVWKTETGESLFSIGKHYKRLDRGMFTAGDTRILTIDWEDGLVRSWDATKAGPPIHYFDQSTGDKRLIGVSANGNRIATGGIEPAEISSPAGSTICILPTVRSSASSFRFARQGDLLVVGGSTPRIFDLSAKRLLEVSLEILRHREEYSNLVQRYGPIFAKSPPGNSRVVARSEHE